MGRRQCRGDCQARRRLSDRVSKEYLFKILRCVGRQLGEGIHVPLVSGGARADGLRDELAAFARVFHELHAEQFFHNAAPPFTVHVGGEASGDFAGRKFHWKVPSEIGFEIVRQLYRQNFDPAFPSTAKIDYAIGIPLTHLGHTDPVLPIYVNAYLPPQPPMERCYAFGQAVARTVTALGLKTVVLASAGISHFPGTDRYSNPELDWDTRALEKLKSGNLKSLIGYDEIELRH